MVLIGADTQGKKHLIGLREGYRESAESWGSLLKDCRRRGFNEPACWIGDGALGLWAAVNEHCPRSAQQRCTNHKTMNVIDKLPVSERPEYTKRLRAVWQADSAKAARRLAGRLATDLRTAGYDRAADCLEDDLDRCLTFYQFPQAALAAPANDQCGRVTLRVGSPANQRGQAVQEDQERRVPGAPSHAAIGAELAAIDLGAPVWWGAAAWPTSPKQGRRGMRRRENAPG